MPSGVYIRTEFHKKKIREGMNGGNSTSFKKGDGLNENNVFLCFKLDVTINQLSNIDSSNLNGWRCKQM